MRTRRNGIERESNKDRHRQIVLSSLLIAVFLMSSEPVSAGKRTRATELDRVAYAVEGAESSHGNKLRRVRAHARAREPGYARNRERRTCDHSRVRAKASTGRRTTKLFLPNGCWHFWSRQAYGLGYACHREDRFSRLQRRAAMLNRQLGGAGISSGRAEQCGS